MKIAIIGAGPAGLTAAYVLSKSNYKVDVYEASGRVGGMSCTIALWNQKVDIGPHRFFSTDKKVNSLWLEIAGKDYRMVNRLTRIYYKGKFFSYPIRVFNALHNLGLYEALRCIISYCKEQLFKKRYTGTFSSWVQSRFGKRLFEIFFKSYTEKLWGLPCDKLDADFAAQRIKRLSLYEAIKNAILQGKGNKHKTLVDEFAYPTGGSGMIYDRMHERIKANGGNVHLHCPVYRIITVNEKVIGLELGDGTFCEYDHIISSMPYSLMVERLPEVPEGIKKLAARLRYRNTILIYLLINETDLFPDNWIYVHSENLKMGRITNFRNWVPQLYNEENKTILAIEYWCNDEDTMWRNTDEELAELAKREIINTHLVKAASIEDHYVLRLHRSYPVYKKGYRYILSPIEEYLSGIENLSVIGRYGSFKYNNQDHSILMGLLAAENIMEGAQHQLHRINTDYETYQESYIVTTTGLSKQ
ncbi:FAD-dependent oxidoreductase [Chitinophaga tropicalis]|uniref:NAD(P)-binding protein n=1 Tax=Chitinophaga tropicalis TaxID=2683588 RepID=A0A7K1U6L0_9BACT|nr:FAD-dependent oxidoreductase [Chitinophaga tropicalis]MVT10003.1 NAD(P)-binding protein [Chitinophaga tropicalis]